MIPGDGSKDRDLLELWESEFDESQLERHEEAVVGYHDGSVHHVPSAVTACTLGLLLDLIDRDVREGTIDQQTHRMYVYAHQLDNVVHDSWNGEYAGND